MNLTEDLRQNDLEHLVSNYVSIDQYTSKLDDDNITVAFFCNEIEVAQDLRDFIEKIYFSEIKDIEISDSLTEDNKHILFVEFERNIMFPKLLIDMLDSVSNLNNVKEWFFKSFDMNDKVQVSTDNIKQYIRLQKLRNSNPLTQTETDDAKDKETEKKPTTESYQPFTVNDNGFKRQYTPMGYISEESFNRIIENSSTLDRDSYETKLLENAFPGYQIITTEKYTFLIKGENILVMA